MKDSFYTSAELAEHLVGYVGNHNVKTVADFCVGGGELLRAAQSKWSGATCFGTDISELAIETLQNDHPDWEVDICDFTNEDARINCKILEDIKFDLILLNPPFTCKGSTIKEIVFNNETFHVSTAMMFLVEALKYLNKNGVLYAILPISAIYSQKDYKIRELLISQYKLTVIEERDNQCFKGCYPNIVIISLNAESRNSKEKQTVYQKTHGINGLSVFRGNLSMYEIIKYCGEGKPLIHSTNLTNNQIEGIKYYVNRSKSEITGPAILIHRVGNPNIKKICLVKKDETYVLSDCVIAIRTQSHQDSLKLIQWLFSNWFKLMNLYKGTGAKYITIKRLKLFLNIQ